MSFAAGSLTRWVVPVLTVLGVALAATSTLTGTAPAIRLVDSGNPIAGHNLYVDPTSAAMAAAHHADPPSAELDAIANTPQAFWIDNAVPSAAIGRYVNGANAAGAMPVLAVYALPHRDCGSFAAGGFGSGDAYRQWIDGVAATVGGTPATFVVEPDALDMADCLSGGQREERYSLIRYAVDAFTRNPAAAVYIDGGHSRWLPAAEIANRLNQVGVNKARGFSLNTSNFFSTDEEIKYGEDVSGRTGGAHYVIDTSRNGAGPAPEAPLNWCNPSGRALGVPPTTATAGPHADAYLWVKRPGDSDGSCGRGEPGPGHFMNQYAIDLARAAHH